MSTEKFRSLKRPGLIGVRESQRGRSAGGKAAGEGLVFLKPGERLPQGAGRVAVGGGEDD